MFRWTYLVILSVGFCHLSGWANPLCESNLTIHIYSPGESIPAGDNREMLKKIVAGLKKYKNLADSGTTTVAKIYRSVSKELGEAIAKGETFAQSADLTQDQVFELAHIFVRVVDFATRFADEVGFYADGFARINSFNQKDYDERREEFVRRFGKDPLEDDFLKSFAAHEVKSWGNPPNNLNYTGYMIDGMYDQKPEAQNYFFQYHYVALRGHIPLRRLFEDRERGIAYYGVSNKPFSPADGSHFGADLFMDHDLFHAFFMKVRDLALFRQLGVTDAASAKQVKQINNELFQKRLAEWTGLKAVNPALHAALEALLFGIVHEQSMSYPMGVDEDLSTEQRREFYKRALTAVIREGELGGRIKRLLGDNVEARLDEALAWLAPRASADAKEFNRRWQQSKP